MRNLQFDTFKETVLADSRIMASVLASYFFYWDGAAWLDSAHRQVLDVKLVDALNRVQGRDHVWSPEGTAYTYFAVRDLKAVVVLQTETPLPPAQRHVYTSQLQANTGNAINKYNATHHGLTGLPNKVAFTERLESAIQARIATMGTRNADDDAATQDFSEALTLFCIDIDHFKQCNDTFGHQYGDLVLRCLGQRMFDICAKLRERFQNRVRLYPAHPSGEEFLLLAEGPLTPEDERHIGEGLRAVVADTLLPSREEWELFEKEGLPEGLSLPHDRDRHVTISVGVASLPPLDALGTAQKIKAHGVGKTLMKQADAALFRAKARGRDRVIHFSEIRMRHGQVLQHHQDMQIVAMDIGSAVDVQDGHEFWVYHPDFCGDTPFMFSDGRTQKSLGKYPRVPMGRIVVFDVQDDISFAQIDKNYGVTNFPVGALLEQVPVGAIRHLIGDDDIISRADTHVLANRMTLGQRVKSLVDMGTGPTAVVYTLTNVDELVHERGTGFVNRVLAQVYRTIRDQFPRGTEIGQVDTSSLAVVYGDLETDNTEALTRMLDVMDDVEEKFHGLPKLFAGVYSERLKEEGDAQHSVLHPIYALDYAQFAAAARTQSDTTRLSTFSTHNVHYVLEQCRRERRYDDCRQLFATLGQIGISGPQVEFQMGMLEFESNNLDIATGHLGRAASMDGKDVKLLVNYGLLLYLSRRYVEAFDTFARVMQVKPNYDWRDAYLVSFALAAFEKYKATPQAIDKNWLTGMVQDAASITTGERADQYTSFTQHISVAMAHLSGARDGWALRPAAQ